MELTKYTLLEAREKLTKKEITSVELTKAFIDEIEKKKNLNAIITDNFEKALEQAKESDKRLQENKARKLEGLPLLLKDNFCTAGLRTTAASKILSDFTPSYESTFSQKLADEGYVLLGKTNMDEFACGSTSGTSYFGAVINSYHSKNDARDLIAGGSSGGSATAVASNMCLAASGTDTGGSIRQPAGIQNLVGIKPTYGRVSRYGIVAYGSSFDQAGWLTKDVRDAAYLTDIVVGGDVKDSTCRDTKGDFFANLNANNAKGLKVGVPKEVLELESKVQPEIFKRFSDTLEFLKKSGVEVVEVSLPTVKYTAEIYTIISYTELASNLSRYDGVRYTKRSDGKTLDELYLNSRADGFCTNVKKRILIGYLMSSAENYEKYFLKAQKARRKLANEFKEAFQKVDILITPTTPQTAFAIEQTEEEKAKNMSSNYLNDLFVCPANMAGLPAISLPAGFDNNGLPIGMHFMADLFQEQKLFDLGLKLEESGFYTRLH